MKTFYLLVVLALIQPAIAADVSSDTSQSIDTKNSKSIDKSESIQVRKAKSKRDVSGKDSRKSNDTSREARAAEQIQLELQAASLFLPLVQRIEAGEIDAGDNEIAALFRDCRYFTDSQLVPLASAGERFSGDELANTALLQVLYGVTERIAYKHSTGDSFSESRARVTGSGIWKRFSWHYSSDTEYRFAPPRDAVRCYYAYGLTIARAIEQLAQGAKVLRPPQSPPLVLIHGDLGARAANALATAMRSPSLRLDIETKTIATTSRACSLATVYVLETSDLSWQCGAFRANATQIGASVGALVVLGENQFMGQRLTFAQVTSEDSSLRATDSRSTYASADSTSESGQDVTIAKRRVGVIDQATSGKTTSQAATRASPK